MTAFADQIVVQPKSHRISSSALNAPPKVFPLSHYEANLNKATKKIVRKKKSTLIKQRTQKYKHRSVHKASSGTLPTHLPRTQYLQHIADELGWEQTPVQKDFCPGVYTVPQYIKNHPLVYKNAPIQITANGPEQFRLKGLSVLKGNVVITQPGRVIYADKVYIFRNSKTNKIDKLAIIGHVRIYQEKSLFVTDSGIVTLYPRTVDIRKIAYHYFSKGSESGPLPGPYNAWGTAASAIQDSNKVITLKHATFSTCPPKSPAWQFSTSTLILDQTNNVGQAYNAVIRLKNIPVFYFPYYNFQLNNDRKTGILFPVIGQTSNSGIYLALPYYFNIAPNYDLLLTPELYGSRGFLLASVFRYLTKSSHGTIFFNFLPDDQRFSKFRRNAINTYSSDNTNYPPDVYEPYLNALTKMKNQRGMLGMRDNSQFNQHLSMRYYLNLVSDPYYLTDVSTPSLSANSTTNQLLNLFQLRYNGVHWDSSLYAQGYQTLHLITQIQGPRQAIKQALDQYRRLPDLNAFGYYPLSDDFSFEIDNDFTNFEYKSILFPGKPFGTRFHLRPGFNLMLENSAAYIKPEVWFDETVYDTQNSIPGINSKLTRGLPIVDIDMGLHLFRHFSMHHDSYNQTLEPRLYYLYVPYTNQDKLPNFDTIQLPFFFDQLYALNTFESYDRIENANQVSFGLSSNIIRNSNGARILSANVGDIYYISQPKVCLIPGCNLTQRDFSPVVANLSFFPNDLWSFTGTVAWDPKFSTTNNAGFGIGYNRGGHRIFHLNYLFVSANPHSIATFTPTTDNTANDFVNNSTHLVFNFAWPLNDRVSALGYSDYDFYTKRFDTLYGGIQYDSCCWAIRLIIKRLFNQSTINQNSGLKNDFEMSYFVELTLKGLGSFGSGTSGLVQSIIPGYKP